MNNLFNYKIIEGNKVGFPKTALLKITQKLDELKISYEITQIGEDVKRKLYKQNNYDKYYDEAKEKISFENKLELALKKLEFMKQSDVLKVIEFINEY